jgi:4-hydroxy-3-methylbut-2-en-1-yl diphosphate synthase IspG/GcpE
VPTFLVISRDSPAECAMHNEKAAKIGVNWMSKHEELEAKHGVKMVGSWSVMPEHLNVLVFEAPSYEAMDAYGMEPEVLAQSMWNTMEFKVAMTLEESAKMMQQRWQK